MQLDQIRIDNLEVYAHHGVYPEEKENGQFFYVNAILYTDTRNAGLQDDLSLSTNYGEVCQLIANRMQENTYDLIESVAEDLAEQILLSFDGVKKIDIEIRKPHAPVPLEFESVSVRIVREWHEVYLSLGSNMGDRRAFLEQGIEGLKQNRRIRVVQVAEMIETEPYGNVEQDEFLNTAVRILTLLTPKELLDYLHKVEQSAGRTREIHWGPRTLDMDILLYDKLIYEDDHLIIPHVDMENRSFVLEPLSKLAPNLRHPLTGRTVTQMLEAVNNGK